jgi:hypothetical protein
MNSKSLGSASVGGDPKRALLPVALACSLALTGATVPVHASPLIFFGEDLNTTCVQNSCSPGNDVPDRLGSRPNSTAAQLAFLANLSGVTTENFEGLTPGLLAAPISLMFGADTATLSVSAASEIRNVPVGTYNGTHPISGNQYLLQNVAAQNTFEIAFSSPQAAFGFFATDIGDAGARLVLTFTTVGGGTESITVPNSTTGTGPSVSGSVLYFGLIDTRNLFTKVTFTNTNSTQDGFGFDDMTVGREGQVVATVPEPATLALFGLGLAGLGLSRRRKAT